MCERGAEPEQQGYCGVCSVVYPDLQQHLSSPQHQDAVSQPPRGIQSSQSQHSLLERFLHDVLKHHPSSCGQSSSDLDEPQRDAHHPPQQHKATPPSQTPAPTLRSPGRHGNETGGSSREAISAPSKASLPLNR
ncbi:hypothetical protein WMY93_025492 [Mugilogobius chulae]|uniref:DBF4-type domain-containing protein n=1 Tax=Mugilogobius chulae TaxID=88201 RepID=A0AAW0MUU2_9GOBI